DDEDEDESVEEQSDEDESDDDAENIEANLSKIMSAHKNNQKALKSAPKSCLRNLKAQPRVTKGEIGMKGPKAFGGFKPKSLVVPPNPRSKKLH
ncbi:unnamed protein product, partial [Protopolystoma xenopodis]